MMTVGWTAGMALTRALKHALSVNASKSCSQITAIRRFRMGNSCGTNFTSNGSQAQEEMLDEYYDRIVCQDSDIADGQMKEVELADKVKCLLVKQNGKLSALSHKCSHFGAPLIKGSLGDGVVRCPWHGACFNTTSGDIEDFPGLDSLHKYEVNVESDGGVRVRAKRSQTGNLRRKPACKMSDGEKTVVIVGGGASAQSCAETLRTRTSNPWPGKIIMLSEEEVRPYDRTLLSKKMMAKADEIALRPESFYKDSAIDFRPGSKVVKLNTDENVVTTGKGDEVKYDFLVLATGGTPRSLTIEGHEKAAKDVHLLRTPSDANAIAEKGKGKNVVIVGTSFIGTEVAAFFSDKAASVTVVGPSAVPLANVLGSEIGQFMMELHQSKGVKFEMETVPEQYVVGDEDGRLKAVKLRNGKSLPADVCVVGIGVAPNTKYACNSGLEMDKRGCFVVDDRMKTNIDNVYAVGDVAAFPLDLPTGKVEANIGHWQLALQHGKNAGLNIANDEPTPLKTVPFFWTMQYGKSVRYAGYAGTGFDDVVHEGDIAEGKFAAYFLKDDKVVAAASLARDPLVADYANHLLSGNSLTRGDIKNEKWRGKYSLEAVA